jgi:hypothetical protein
MKHASRPWLLIIGLLSLTGCGDTDSSILRTALNYKSELIDQLMKVNDEESAKKFMDYYLKQYTEKNMALDDKWNKWCLDIEADFRHKKKVVKFESSGQPGDDQFRQDAIAAMEKEDERIKATRMMFLDFLSQDAANTRRLKREFDRIQQLINHLKEENVGGEKAGAKDAENWPNLVKIKDSFKTVGITGTKPQDMKRFNPKNKDPES